MALGEETRVVIIGGGATGTGILRDLALRGVPALLIEQEDLAHGTSSRFHGLLHSGARYVLSDEATARECLEENLILRQIAPNCVEETGGVFLQLPGDDPNYACKWLEACRETGMRPQEVDPKELGKTDPALTKEICRAFRVPDCAVDGFRVIWGNVHSAREQGAKLLSYNKVKSIRQQNGRVVGVEVENKLTGEKKFIRCQLLINAAGAWTEEVADMAGVQLEVIKDKGTLLAFNHRFVSQVINRLREPGDGDIFVPHGTITILGTTSRPVEDPACSKPTREEVLELLKIGRETIPHLEEYRLIRAFAGVRPLYLTGEKTWTRAATRNFALLDHYELDGLEGFISIVGGKFTTFRLMAEKTADLAARYLGISTPCRTAQEPLAESVNPKLHAKAAGAFGYTGAKKAVDRLGKNLATVLETVEKVPEQAKMVCECELVSLAEIDYIANDGDSYTLGDIRRKTRIGMGTCQGTFCGYRTLGVLSRNTGLQGSHLLLRDFLQKRWKGIRPVLWGQQLREAQLSTGIYCALFNLERSQ